MNTNTKMPMPITTLLTSSSSNTTSETRRKSRDLSFSSYLEDDEATFVLQLQRTTSNYPLGLKNRTQDREIDVFDAEKYFKEGPKLSPSTTNTTTANHSLHAHQLKKDELPLVEIKEPPTPSICSESSSWNSRGALLNSVAKNRIQYRRKASKKSFLTNIRCKCSCGDDKSVDIDDYNEESGSRKSVSNSLANGRSKEGDRTSLSDNNSSTFDDHETGVKVNSNRRFSFPVLDHNTDCGSQVAKLQAQEEVSFSPRKSLEVFGSPVMMEDGKNCLRVEKKLAWDAIANEQIKFVPIAKEMDNDSSSETSSDLFEIESLSKGDPFLSRTTSLGTNPTTCYAPSEASVEWSVVTASAADFSVLSDFEELRTTTPIPQNIGLKSRNGAPVREMPKRYSGILSGCKNQKAVGVAENVYRANKNNNKILNSRRHIHSESSRFKEENNKRLAGLFRQQSFDARVLSISHSTNAPQLLYTK